MPPCHMMVWHVKTAHGIESVYNTNDIESGTESGCGIGEKEEDIAMEDGGAEAVVVEDDLASFREQWKKEQNI